MLGTAPSTVKGYAVEVRNLHPPVMPFLDAADESGVAGVFRRHSGYPFRQNEDSITGHAEAAQRQRAMDRNRSERIRRDARQAASRDGQASDAARQRARDAARTRTRHVVNPTLGQRRRQNDAQRQERRAR